MKTVFGRGTIWLATAGVVLAVLLAILVAEPMIASALTQQASKTIKNTALNRVSIQVDQNDKAVMDLTLNNANNVLEHFKAKGEPVTVEIVTFGPGLHMLRDDTSPVKDRIAAMSLQHPELRFSACGNTQANMSRAEGKPVSLVSEAKVTASGVVRLMELQGQGYSYIRP